MGRSTEYYRTHPEARKKKAKKDKEINARPEQKAKRRELGRKNYETDKKKGWRAGGKARIVLIPRTVLGINQ